MTKSQQIMALYDGKRTTAEIAKIVGCKPEYVRVVARQRKGKGQSEIDWRYLESDLGRAARKRHNRHHNQKRLPQLKASFAAYRTVISQTGSKDKAREAGKAAYDAARLQGKTSYEARQIRSRVYQRILSKTADRHQAAAASRQAYARAPKLEAAE